MDAPLDPPLRLELASPGRTMPLTEAVDTLNNFLAEYNHRRNHASERVVASQLDRLSAHLIADERRAHDHAAARRRSKAGDADGNGASRENAKELKHKSKKHAKG